MSWQPTDPFSGTSISHNFGALDAAAQQLEYQKQDVGSHGAKLNAHTQRPVGSGTYGAIVNDAVGRIVSAVGDGFTGALQGFYGDTATRVRQSGSRFQAIEAETAARHTSIGPHGKPPALFAGWMGMAAVDRNVNLSAVTPQPLVPWNGKTTWRSDDRPPSAIFGQGFGPKDTSNYDLLDYVHNNTPSAFVSTTKNPELYQRWGSQYLYTIQARPAAGIDVNATLGEVIKPGEEEVAFPGGIMPTYIQGGHTVVSTDPIRDMHAVWLEGTLGEGVEHHPSLPANLKGMWIPNPHFEPGYRSR